MSRIGKLPVPIPPKVKVKITGQTIAIEGPKGKLSREFDHAVSLSEENGGVVVRPRNESRFSRAMWGTARSVINGMVLGVQEPFKKDLEIQGVGFKAALQGKVLDVALGYSHPIKHPIPEGITVEVDKTGTKLSITGCDKALVGKVAAEIKSYYPVEPYKGKGVRIVGEYVRRKEGKKTS